VVPTTAPPQPSAPTPPPSQPPRLVPSHPEGAIHLECTVRAEIEAQVVRDQLRLRFVLRNSGPNDATVTLRTACPGGAVELSGLPAGFDPMHRCQAGACVQPTTTTTYKVPGGHKKVVIGETMLPAKGDACNPPLPLGSTFLQAMITPVPQAFDVCNGGQVHLVRDPTSGTLRLAGLLDEPVPATAPTKAPTTKPTKTKPEPIKPAPTVTPKRKQCPVCGIGCPNGIPSTKVGPDGCPSCSCENFEIKAPGP
jgi:hypothetical protein